MGNISLLGKFYTTASVTSIGKSILSNVMLSFHGLATRLIIIVAFSIDKHHATLLNYYIQFHVFQTCFSICQYQISITLFIVCYISTNITRVCKASPYWFSFQRSNAFKLLNYGFYWIRILCCPSLTDVFKLCLGI